MRLRGWIAAGAIVGLAAACSPPGGSGGGSTTTTTAPTTTTTSPVATAGHVAGLTENQVCGGPIRVPPSPCTSPFLPASDQVTVTRGSVVVAKLQSASNGVFSLDLPAGPYTFVAAANDVVIPLDTIVLSNDCPPVTATVVAGATVAVTLTCSVGLETPVAS